MLAKIRLNNIAYVTTVILYIVAAPVSCFMALGRIVGFVWFMGSGINPIVLVPAFVVISTFFIPVRFFLSPFVVGAFTLTYIGSLYAYPLDESYDSVEIICFTIIIAYNVLHGQKRKRETTQMPVSELRTIQMSSASAQEKM